MKNKTIQLKSISVIVFFLLFVSIGTNKLIKLNQANNYLKKAQEVKPLKEQLEPQYSVEIKETPALNYLGFTFKATIKNISVKPYITNFGFFECNFVDSKNNVYSGHLPTGTAFNQAVLPNKSQDFVIKDVNVNIPSLDNTLEGLKKCSYDDKGKNQCNLITNLKIIDCIGYITTDGEQPSRDSLNENPIKVTFP